MGGAPLFSIQRGKKDDEEAAGILGNCFVMLLLCGVFLTVVIMAVKKPVLYLLGASDQTYVYADAYLTIYLFGTVFVMLSLGLNQFISAQGFGTTGMLTIVIGAGLNIVLDPVFIYGLHMGVRGAAVATVISQFVSAVWTLRFLLGKRAVVRLQKKYMPLQKKRIGRILGLGASSFTMGVTNSLVQMVCNATLQNMGGDIYVGVMTIINSIREVAPDAGIRYQCRSAAGHGI